MSKVGRVGEIIVFPSSNEDLCKLFKIPPRVTASGPLLLVLMPCHIPPAIYENAYCRVDEIRSSLIQPEGVQLKTKALLYAQSLKLPDWFLKFLLFSPRQYTIWAHARGQNAPFKQGAVLTNAVMNSDERDPDTYNLFRLMESLKGENVRAESSSLRIVYLHVAAIATAHQLTLLAKWRCEKPELRFVAYGSHDCIKPCYWGFNEIWTLGPLFNNSAYNLLKNSSGGIVTFTANAMLDDLPEVERLIQQIDKHPFWTSYIHPHTLAVFIRKSCPDGEAPISFYRR